MKLFFKAGFGDGIGLGHIKRCLNLANYLQSNFSITFLIINNNLKDENIIDKKKFKVIYSKSNKEILKKSKYIFNSNEYNFLIIDDYSIDYNWEKKIYKYVNKLFVIDDFINRKHYCDYYLNQNVTNKDIKKSLIAKSNNTSFFLGSKYALLDKNYNFYFNKKKKHHSFKKIFISFGGIDEENVAAKILKLFSSKKHNKLKITAAIPDLKKFNLLKIKYRNYKNIKLINKLDSLARIIYNSDFIIGSAGTTSFERLCLFKTSLVFCLAKNQEIIFNQLRKKKIIIDGGNIDKLNRNKFDNLIDLIKSKYNSFKENIENHFIFVDGLGAKRISEIILNTQKRNIVLKRAKINDVYLYYNWINDEKVREHSINSSIIDFRTHKRWFLNQLKSKKNILYVMYLNNLPMGQIRINVKNLVGKMDYSVDKDFRGKGFGYILIKKVLTILKKIKIKKLLAEVKEKNIYSIKIFKKLKFKELKKKNYKNIKTFEIILKN